MGAWAAGLGLLLLLGGGALLYRYLMGILVSNLLRTPELHLDFTSRDEGDEDPPVEPGLDAPRVLFLHEFAADGASARKYVGFLSRLGYRVTAPDLPELDAEGPRWFLYREVVEAARRELDAALAEADGRPLVVFGVSRGANAAVAALAEDPAGVAGLVTDGFASSVDLVEDLIRRFAPIYIGRALSGLLPTVFVRFTARRGLAVAGARMGTSFPDVGPALGRLPFPVLMIHGGRDRTVPVHLLEERYRPRAPEGSEVLVVEGARHNEACLKDPEGYRARVLAYLSARGTAPVSASSRVNR